MLTATNSLLTHCYPVNRDASFLLIPRRQFEWTTDMPSPCPVSPAEIKLRHKSRFADLTGLRKGTIVIVALLEYKEEGKSSWIARCDCGRYGIRSHYKFLKSVRNGKFDTCPICLKRMNEEYRRLNECHPSATNTPSAINPVAESKGELNRK